MGSFLAFLWEVANALTMFLPGHRRGPDQRESQLSSAQRAIGCGMCVVITLIVSAMVIGSCVERH
jgi:hypothetical protein